MFFTISAIVVTIAVILIYAYRKPDTFRYERSLTIAASPETIFPYLNDVTKQILWSPWEKKDPAMKKTHEGPLAGVGAIDTWDGNRQVGAGRAEIIESVPNERVATKLQFYRPMAGEATAEYLLAPEDGMTRVTWAMHGKQDFKSKLIGTVIDCETICGKEFDKGLHDLKRLVESAGA